MWLRIDLVYALPSWAARTPPWRGARKLEKTLFFVFFGSIFYLLCCSQKYSTFYPIKHSGYCVVYNFTKSERRYHQVNLEAVTLALHTSIDFFGNIFDQVSTWDAGISLSVYLESDRAEYAAFLWRTHHCDPAIRERVSLHLVWAKTFFDEECGPISVEHGTCYGYDRVEVLSMLSAMDRPSVVYPINVMRNIARKGAASTLHLLSDIEMLFSENAASLLIPLANILLTNHKKMVLVIRRFEMEKWVPVPRNTLQLKELYDTKRAIEFHSLIFAKGHHIPYIHSWFNRSINEEKITASAQTYTDSFWEPQVLLHSEAPYHDETIPTRHRDHQALAYELCRAGYRFFVVTKVFNVHRGIKNTVTWLDKEVERLGEATDQKRGKMFYHRMNVLYPGTFTKCARWNTGKNTPRPLYRVPNI